jgi:hypothetical protein
MRPLTVEQKSERAHKRAQQADAVRRNNTPKPDPEYATRAAPNAYTEGFRKVANEADAALRRQVTTLITGRTLETYGVDHVREILTQNAHTRTLVVKERVSTRVVGPQRANDAYTRTQNKVTSAVNAGVGKASEREALRARLTHAQNMFKCTTGKERKRWGQACTRLTTELHTR